MAVLPPPRPLIRDAFIPVGTLEPTKLATIYGQGLFVSSEGVITADKALSPRVRNALQKYGFENVAHEPEVPQEERIIKALHEMLENGEKLKVMENTPACVSCIHFNSPPPNPYTSSVSRCAHPIHAKYTHDPVSGQKKNLMPQPYCKTERSEGLCGENGVLFEEPEPTLIQEFSSPVVEDVNRLIVFTPFIALLIVLVVMWVL